MATTCPFTPFSPLNGTQELSGYHSTTSGCESSHGGSTTPSNGTLAAKNATRVRTIKEVVTGIYRETEGTVVTLKKIQRLGFEAEDVITQHFKTTFGLTPCRVEVVHSRRHTKSPHATGAIRSPNIAYAVFSDPTAVDLVMGYTSARVESIQGVEVALQRFCKRDKKESVCPAPEVNLPRSVLDAAQKCPVVQAAAVDPVLALAVLDWLQMHDGVFEDNHPPVELPMGLC